MSQLFTVASYNIWFDKTLCLERALSLIESINLLNPDVICLQEVRPEIYDILVEFLIEYKYYFPKKLKKTYGCVTFSKHPIIKCLDYSYSNSQMGRSLIITKIDYTYHTILENSDNEINKKIEIVVANTHFESLFKKNIENKTKLEQYKNARVVLDSLHAEYRNVVLCSDTNVMKNEEVLFDLQFKNNSWIDAWEVKGTELNKYTYNSENNVYLQIQQSKFKSRLDRILYKIDNCIIDNFDIIVKNNEVVEISDHYGIYAKFVII